MCVKERKREREREREKIKEEKMNGMQEVDSDNEFMAKMEFARRKGGNVELDTSETREWPGDDDDDMEGVEVSQPVVQTRAGSKRPQVHEKNEGVRMSKEKRRTSNEHTVVIVEDDREIIVISDDDDDNETEEEAERCDFQSQSDGEVTGAPASATGSDSEDVSLLPWAEGNGTGGGDNGDGGGRDDGVDDDDDDDYGVEEDKENAYGGIEAALLETDRKDAENSPEENIRLPLPTFIRAQNQKKKRTGPCDMCGSLESYADLWRKGPAAAPNLYERCYRYFLRHGSFKGIVPAEQHAEQEPHRRNTHAPVEMHGDGDTCMLEPEQLSHEPEEPTSVDDQQPASKPIEAKLADTDVDEMDIQDAPRENSADKVVEEEQLSHEPEEPTSVDDQQPASKPNEAKLADTDVDEMDIQDAPRENSADKVVEEDADGDNDERAVVEKQNKIVEKEAEGSLRFPDSTAAPEEVPLTATTEKCSPSKRVREAEEDNGRLARDEVENGRAEEQATICEPSDQQEASPSSPSDRKMTFSKVPRATKYLPKETQLTCQGCGITFKNSAELSYHMKSTGYCSVYVELLTQYDITVDVREEEMLEDKSEESDASKDLVYQNIDNPVIVESGKTKIAVTDKPVQQQRQQQRQQKDNMSVHPRLAQKWKPLGAKYKGKGRAMRPVCCVYTRRVETSYFFFV